MPSTTHAQSNFRKRTVHLLETVFANIDEDGRRFVFNQAFENSSPNPAHQIEFSGAAADFAADAADKLLAYGCSGRGKHALSVLLATVESLRGRQMHPDYADLPAALDDGCALPRRAEERDYLTRLIEESEAKARLYSTLSGVAATRPGSTTLDPWTEDPALELIIRRESRERISGQQASSREYRDIQTAFTEVDRVALLGPPGSGKSTSLRKLALDLATRALADPKAPIPLLAALNLWVGDKTLTEFLTEHSPEVGWAIETLAKANRLVLLLDGINEIPPGERALRVNGIRSLCGKLEKLNPSVGIVVSCRREDYIGELDMGFDTLTLEPLSPPRIRAALHQWVTSRGKPAATAEKMFWQLAGDERLADVLRTWLAAGASEEAFWVVSAPSDKKHVYAKTTGEEDELWHQRIPNPRSLLRLASNPFMFTMLFLVRWTEGQLPKNRADLFDCFTAVLLKRERLADAECRQLLADLSKLAWQMQNDFGVRGQKGNREFGLLTVVARETAIQALSSEEHLKKALNSTLLEGGDEICFRHQLLQEYFAARALRDKIDKSEIRAEDLWLHDRWWDRTGWEETAVLLAGFFPEDCSRIIFWLINAQPEVAVRCIQDSGAEIANPSVLLQKLQSIWLPRLTNIEREPAPEARAAIGRCLGRLGLDCRKGTGLRFDGIPDMDWVEIPGGDFVYQEGERRKTETFQIARYPVTNAQFDAFLGAKNGYADDRWWKGLGHPDRTPRRPSWSETNHPRETVSWHEAMAFCAWLGHGLKRAVRLPTEWQWERAARGLDGRKYPWGNEDVCGYANINDTAEKRHYLSRTSAVGIYPQSASLEGVLDLAGNVWEWCLNEFEKPDRTRLGGAKSRVLRGGSWVIIQDNSRADFRYMAPPSSRLSDVGFRVVVPSANGPTEASADRASTGADRSGRPSVRQKLLKAQ